MQGADIHSVLKQKGVTHLYHANSVETSVTFLEQGGLRSRGFVEAHGLKQTPQSSDGIDKAFGVWNFVFLDPADIHDQSCRIKAPNQYGPVLFVFGIDVLLKLPPGSDVLATKMNPCYWHKTMPDQERWFLTSEEVNKSVNPGEFGKMLVIRTASGKIDFPNQKATIILDDPNRQLSSNASAYTHALGRLGNAGTRGKIQATITRRSCRPGCVCLPEYSKWTSQKLDLLFG